MSAATMTDTGREATRMLAEYRDAGGSMGDFDEPTVSQLHGLVKELARTAFRARNRCVSAAGYESRYPLHDLGAVAYALLEAEGHLNAATHQLAADMRRAGASWQQVGDALGITRQAAQQRFSVKETCA
jgi:hypothetical protein